jgi:hypothetical protein
VIRPSRTVIKKVFIPVQNVRVVEGTIFHPCVTFLGDDMTWYSGWYAGAAKRRGIDPARVQYAIRNVADYCKANQNRRLAEALTVLLKSA